MENVCGWFSEGREEEQNSAWPQIIYQLSETRALLFGHMPPAMAVPSQAKQSGDSLGVLCCHCWCPLSSSGVQMSHGLLTSASSPPPPPSCAQCPPLCASPTTLCHRGLKQLGTLGSLSVPDQRHETSSKAGDILLWQDDMAASFLGLFFQAFSIKNKIN